MVGAGIFINMSISGQGETIHIYETPEPPTPESDSEEIPIEETPEPAHPEYEEYQDEEESFTERILPELSEGPIRWHIYPTWDFDQVFNFNEGMAGVEYFEVPGIWDSMHTLGYINRYGEILIPIDHVHEAFHYGYSGAPPFVDGRLALMCQNRGGVGVFDTEGSLVVPFYYRGGWAFSHELLVVLRYDRWGFIDRYGNEVIPLKFEDAGRFSEGLAPVMQDGNWGFINTSGEVVISFIIQQAYEEIFGDQITPRFSDGLTAVSTGEREENERGEWVNNIRWGFMDRDGNMAIPFQFTNVRDFSNGLASVSLGGWGVEEHEVWGTQQRWGKIDIAGNVILPFEYTAIHPYVGGALLARGMDSSLRLYDGNGNIIIPPDRYDDIMFFSEGRAPVRSIGGWDDTAWGVIDIQGNEIVPPVFDAVEPFTQGFAPVRMGGWETTPDGSHVNNARWGFIDLEGDIVVPIKFDEVRNFSEGLAWVKFEGYWGLIEIVDE